MALYYSLYFLGRPIGRRAGCEADQRIEADRDIMATVFVIALSAAVSIIRYGLRIGGLGGPVAERLHTRLYLYIYIYIYVYILYTLCCVVV